MSHGKSMQAIIGTNATITHCLTKVKVFWVKYDREMVAKIVSLAPTQHGAFLTKCPAHYQIGSAQWSSTSINGTTMGHGFATWWSNHARGDPAAAALVALDGTMHAV